MNSRERFIKTLNHMPTDKVVLDLGATSQTGINASPLYQLRRELGLPEKPIKVHEPAQILGEVDEDLIQALGVDVIGLWNPDNILGVKNDNWKPWRMPDGTPALMAGGMQFSTNEKGATFIYPQGDNSVEPSMIMLPNGYFFDNIDRGGDYDEDNLNAKKDFADDFPVFTDETALYLENQSKKLYEETNYGIIGMCGGGGFGDVFLLPACWLKNKPHGIRKIEDWYIAHVLYQDYIMELFELQSEVALKNLEIYRQAVGDRVQVIWLSGTDFGTQTGTFTSVEIYRKLYKPFHKKLNDWVHKNTNWKTFYHTDGSIISLMDDFADAGVDILNPIQCSAEGMDPKKLKDKYGDKFVFWGAGVDTQHVLPFGTPDEVKTQVKERIDILSENGGYVFSTIHNIIGKTPVKNLIAMFEVLKNYNKMS